MNTNNTNTFDLQSNFMSSEFGRKFRGGYQPGYEPDLPDYLTLGFVRVNGYSIPQFVLRGKRYRFNRGYGLWASECGTFIGYWDGEYWIQHNISIIDVTQHNDNNRKTSKFYSYCSQRRGNGYNHLIHHVMGFIWCEGYIKNLTIVDHIDGDGTNNSASNLQYMTKEQNLDKYRRGEH